MYVFIDPLPTRPLETRQHRRNQSNESASPRLGGGQQIEPVWELASRLSNSPCHAMAIDESMAFVWGRHGTTLRLVHLIVPDFEAAMYNIYYIYDIV